MATQAIGEWQFGDLLRYWRGVRRVSQFELAMEAEVSARHVSFLETGRARPSRDMVHRLAVVLGLPLRERNDLLTCAGFARAYAESDLEEPAMERFRHVIQLILDKQEPYPALVFDRHWNILATNGASQALMQRLLPAAVRERHRNGMELLFAQDGLQPLVENWREVASAMLARVYREMSDSPADRRLARLYKSLSTGPAVPADWRAVAAALEPGPVLPLVLRDGNGRLSLFTTLTTFGTPNDVTLQELRIESYFPMDGATERLLASFADAAAGA